MLIDLLNHNHNHKPACVILKRKIKFKKSIKNIAEQVFRYIKKNNLKRRQVEQTTKSIIYQRNDCLTQVLNVSDLFD